MRNTGILYSSTERKPVVLPELAELLPPLSGEQLAALEADLLRNGCYHQRICRYRTVQPYASFKISSKEERKICL